MSLQPLCFSQKSRHLSPNFWSMLHIGFINGKLILYIIIIVFIELRITFITGLGVITLVITLSRNDYNIGFYHLLSSSAVGNSRGRASLSVTQHIERDWNKMLIVLQSKQETQLGPHQIKLLSFFELFSDSPIAGLMDSVTQKKKRWKDRV